MDLLRLLQAAEVERAETWHRPLGLPESPPSVVGRVSPARWRVHVATAWDVSPRLALSLPERLPENAVVSAELARLVAQHAHDPAIQAIPRAAMLLADGVVAARGGGDGVELGGYTAANGGPKAAAAANGGGDSDHTPLDALTLWAPAPLLQAMSMLGGAAGGVPAVRAYALRSLEACPAEQVRGSREGGGGRKCGRGRVGAKARRHSAHRPASQHIPATRDPSPNPFESP